MPALKRTVFFMIIILTLSLLLAACGGGSETAQNEPQPEAEDLQVEIPLVAAGSEEENEGESEGEAESEGGMETYVIVPAESRASYLVDEEFLQDSLSKLGIEAGRQDVVGSTQVVEGQIQLNPQNLTLGENRFMVDLSTLESNQDRRDNWIRENGPTFNRFPEAVFSATALSGMPETYTEGEEIQFQVEGDLTVHEVTVPVTFDARATLEDNTLAGVLTTNNLMSNFGIEPPSFVRTLTVADEFGIEVEFTAIKQ